jgi:hypothetical protein
MKMQKDTITHLMWCGYLTLQVPEIEVNFGTPLPESAYVDAPDEWFMRLSGDLPSSRGFLHLSRAGYEANKTAIREAFEVALADPERRRAESWADFEAFVVKHFENINRAVAKKAERLEKQAAALRKVRV